MPNTSFDKLLKYNHKSSEKTTFLDTASNCFSPNRYGKLLMEQKHQSDRLLSETNREIDIQRRLQESEVKRRESLAAFQQTNKENQQIIDVRDKQVFVNNLLSSPLIKSGQMWHYYFSIVEIALKLFMI